MKERKAKEMEEKKEKGTYKNTRKAQMQAHQKKMTQDKFIKSFNEKDMDFY